MMRVSYLTKLMAISTESTTERQIGEMIRVIKRRTLMIK